jgi:hypothetical protein
MLPVATVVDEKIVLRFRTAFRALLSSYTAQSLNDAQKEPTTRVENHLGSLGNHHPLLLPCDASVWTCFFTAYLSKSN